MYGDLLGNLGNKFVVVLVVGVVENLCRIEGLICRVFVLIFYWILFGFGFGCGGVMSGSGFLGK